MLIHAKVFNQTFSYISKSFHINFKSNTISIVFTSYQITNKVKLSETLQIGG